VSLGGRYTSGLESKLAQDLKRIDEIIAGRQPKYDWPIDVSPEFIGLNGYFSAGRSYIKALLCLLAYHQPKSFIDNSIVTISNDWLKRANSKNYHHFFPKAYLSKIGEEYGSINHIANIAIVDDYLNKREIGAQPPSRYMKRFIKQNRTIAETMKSSHLIDIERDDILNDNWKKFYKNRLARFSRELKKRIIPSAADDAKQTTNFDDFEEGGEES
jgi:hypothetical protein